MCNIFYYRIIAQFICSFSCKWQSFIIFPSYKYNYSIKCWTQVHSWSNPILSPTVTSKYVLLENLWLIPQHFVSFLVKLSSLDPNRTGLEFWLHQSWHVTPGKVFNLLQASGSLHTKRSVQMYLSELRQGLNWHYAWWDKRGLELLLFLLLIPDWSWICMSSIASC